MIARFFIKKHRSVLILFVISFTVHLSISFFLFSRYGNDVLFFENEDAYGYVNLAKSMAAGQGLARDGMPSALRPPIYPLLLSFIYLLNLSPTWSILILQNIIASLAGVILYKIGQLLFSEKAGQVAGYIYALEPYMLMTANLAITETLFNFLIISFSYFFIKYFIFKNGYKYLILSSLLAGLSVLTKPVALYLPVIICLLFLIKSWLDKRLKYFIISSLAFIFVFLIILSPWSLRQYSHYRTFNISNSAAIMLYFRTAPLMLSHKEKISYGEAISRLWQDLRETHPGIGDDDLNNSFQYYDYMVGRAKELVAENPMLLARYYVLSLGSTMFGTGYDYMLEKVIGLKREALRPSYTDLFFVGSFNELFKNLFRFNSFQLSLAVGLFFWLAIYLLILYSLIRREVWRQHTLSFLFLLLMASYFIFFALGPASHTRYRMPSFPFLFLLLAYSIDFLLRKWHDRTDIIRKDG